MDDLDFNGSQFRRLSGADIRFHLKRIRGSAKVTESGNSIPVLYQLPTRQNLGKRAAVSSC